MELNITRTLTRLALTASLALALAACEDKDTTLNMPEAQLLNSVVLHVTPELPLAIGADSAISYSVAPLHAVNTGLCWKSANELVATVDQNGVITARSLGATTITAVPAVGFGNPSTVKAITVKVIDHVVKVESIDIPNTETDLYEGDKLQLTVTFTPANHTYSHLFWTSSDETVATVDADGLVTGLKDGNVVIKAKTQDSGAYKEFPLTIRRSIPAEDVNIQPQDEPFYYMETRQLEVVTVPADATRATLSWSSSDESVITVDASGKVFAKNFGTATVTCTCNDTGNTSEIELTVGDCFWRWSSHNNFKDWQVYNNVGRKAVVADGKLHCTVSDDANRRIYVTPFFVAGAAAQDKFKFNVDRYPIMAFEADGAIDGSTVNFNTVNVAKTISITKAMTKLTAADGNVVYYYDLSSLSSFNDDKGQVGVRGVSLNILKSPVDEFDIHWIGTFPSVQALQDFIK